MFVVVVTDGRGTVSMQLGKFVNECGWEAEKVMEEARECWEGSKGK